MTFPPSPNTDPASATTAVTATLNGTVNPNGVQLTDCHFEYVTDAAFQATGFTDLASGGSVSCSPDAASIAADSTPHSVSAAITGLSSATAYRFRLLAASSAGTTESGATSFTTAPAFTDLGTDPATGVQAFSATLNGHLDPDGIPTTDCHFEYLTDAAFQANSPADRFAGSTTAPCLPDPGSGSGEAAVHADVSGLSTNTAYRFRLIATNANGTTPGVDKSFTTTPVAVTDPATTTHHTDAVLNGHLNPSGDPGITHCQFDWVDDAQFQIDGFASANTVDCAEGDSFAAPADVSAFINDLTPDVPIHFRLHLTTTDHGDATGADRTVIPPPFTSEFTELTAFGPDGTPATTFSFGGPAALTIDQTQRRLFVVNNDVQAGAGIYGFDASTPPTYSLLPGFGPLDVADAQFNPGVAVDNTALPSADDIYYLSNQTVKTYGFDSNGNPRGGNFPITLGFNACGIAVGSAGDIWIGQLGHVLHYDSAGNPLGQLDIFTQFNGPPSSAPCSLAVNSEDDLFVSTLSGSVWRYSAASGYDPAAATVIAQPSNNGFSHSIAIDPSTQRLYLANGNSVSEYSRSGLFLQEFATGIPNAFFHGISVDATNHDVYVADAGNHKVRVFQPGIQVKTPTITPQDPTAIIGTSATLHAKVDPETFAVTDCHFDYVSDSQFQIDGFSSANTATCSPDPGSGSGDVAVSADLTGLDPASVYHFRIVASNANPQGTATGAAQTLTTRGPIISATHANPVTATDATLNAQVNPQGISTTYHFDYGPTASYGSSTPESPAPIGGNVDRAVSAQIAGLDPATTYHFRLVAKNADATVEGPDAHLHHGRRHRQLPQRRPAHRLRLRPARLPRLRAGQPGRQARRQHPARPQHPPGLGRRGPHHLRRRRRPAHLRRQLGHLPLRCLPRPGRLVHRRPAPRLRPGLHGQPHGLEQGPLHLRQPRPERRRHRRLSRRHRRRRLAAGLHLCRSIRQHSPRRLRRRHLPSHLREPRRPPSRRRRREGQRL